MKKEFESNFNKINENFKFAKELSNDTQFISVTHRRGTMEAADYIYGVTMQENLNYTK